MALTKLNFFLLCAYCSSHACLKTCYSHPTTCHRSYVTYAIASFFALKLLSVRVKPEYNYMGHNDYCFLIIPSTLLFHNARLVSTHIQFLYITNLSQCHIFSLFQVVTLGRGWLLKGNPVLQSKFLIVNDMFEEIILCLRSYLMLAYASVYFLVLWFGG